MNTFGKSALITDQGKVILQELLGFAHPPNEEDHLSTNKRYSDHKNELIKPQTNIWERIKRTK